MSVYDFEAAKGGPFTFQYEGEVLSARSPVDLDFQEVLALLQHKLTPASPGMLRGWQVDALHEAWAAHYDLPPYEDANRLTYLLDHYGAELTYDLQGRLQRDLGELWRARRWRTLLHLIDRLPRDSWFNAAVSGDEEHAKMIAESMAAREDGDGEDSGPPLQGWSEEIERLTQIYDAVRGVQYAIIAVNSQGNTPEAPKPTKRPTTALEKALERQKYASRKARHDSLVSRMLPHKG